MARNPDPRGLDHHRRPDGAAPIPPQPTPYAPLNVQPSPTAIAVLPGRDLEHGIVDEGGRFHGVHASGTQGDAAKAIPTAIARTRTNGGRSVQIATRDARTGRVTRHGEVVAQVPGNRRAGR